MKTIAALLVLLAVAVKSWATGCLSDGYGHMTCYSELDGSIPNQMESMGGPNWRGDFPTHRPYVPSAPAHHSHAVTKKQRRDFKVARESFHSWSVYYRDPDGAHDLHRSVETFGSYEECVKAAGDFLVRGVPRSEWHNFNCLPNY